MADTELSERTLRGIATRYLTDIGDTARLLALGNMAGADAVITSWAEKRQLFFWRPITAIREGEHDGNPRTTGDATWLPSLPTPAYPDYTSGANNLVGAITRVLERFFGQKLTFEVTSTTTGGTKTYDRPSDMTDDMVDVRVYQGIHFRFSDEVGRRTGRRAGDWAYSHFLRPL